MPAVMAIATHLVQHVDDLCRRARPAGRALACLPDAARVAALHAVAAAVEAAAASILAANAEDLARADAEHHAASRQVVEHRDAIGDHQRMVVGQRDDARSQPDPTRPLRRRPTDSVPPQIL